MGDPEDTSGPSHSGTLGGDLSMTVAQGAPVQDSACSACRETGMRAVHWRLEKHLQADSGSLRAET